MDAWKTATLKEGRRRAGQTAPPRPSLQPLRRPYRDQGRHLLKALPNLGEIKFGESNVRVFGNTALVKGPIMIINNGTTPPSTSNLSVLQVWLKGKNGWQLVARHSNKLP